MQPVLLQICRDSVRSFEGGIACGVYQFSSAAALAFFEIEQSHVDSEAIVQMALLLLGEEGLSQTAAVAGSSFSPTTPRELYVSGAVHGYARLLPEKGVIVLLISSATNNVGTGWAALSVLASRVEGEL